MVMDYLLNREDLRDPEIINKWKLILTPEDINSCVKKCADTINDKFRGKNIILVCILKGAVYFFVDLSRYLKIPYSCYFIEASSYHNDQTQSDKINIGSQIEKSKFIDKYVILIDELYDNGHTMEYIREMIHTKADVPLDRIFTCTLFKKNKPSILSDKLDLYGIEVPNVWLVGYGLDDRQEKRGWTHLYACPKTVGLEPTADDIIFTNENEYQTIRKKLKTESEKI